MYAFAFRQHVWNDAHAWINSTITSLVSVCIYSYTSFGPLFFRWVFHFVCVCVCVCVYVRTYISNRFQQNNIFINLYVSNDQWSPSLSLTFPIGNSKLRSRNDVRLSNLPNSHFPNFALLILNFQINIYLIYKIAKSIDMVKNKRQ